MKVEDVLYALEELSQEELEKFKWFLHQPETHPGLPAIKKTILEKAKSTDIVDAMVQTFTLQRCLEVTSTILEKIYRNDLRQRFCRYENPENKMNRPVVPPHLKKQQSVKNLEDRMCLQHDKPLELFCRTDQTRLCALCILDHKNHELVPLSKESEGKKAELRKTEAEGQEMIQERRLKIQEVRETVKRAVSQMKETLWEEMEKRLELKRVQQFAVDVTLDPDTAHPKLILSDDKKLVTHGDVWKNLPDNPERFTKFPYVLAEQSFSSGRFYFQVQVIGKTDWYLGVARESVERKGDTDLSTENGFWTIVLRDGNQYCPGHDDSVRLHLHPGPERVGLFVDYDEGLVSFYDVDAADLIYSFTGCCFKEKLYPYFGHFLNNSGSNSAPMIICPVNQAGCC